MLTGSSNQKIKPGQFPLSELAQLLERPEQDIWDCYCAWKQRKRQDNPQSDQALIAALLRQSKTTVSNYINKRFGSISNEKREMLHKVIELLGYIPSQSAQMVSAKEKKVIGVVANISETASKDYISGLLRGLRSQAKQYTYQLFLFDLAQDKQEAFIRKMPFLGLVDGLIIVGSVLENDSLQRLEQRNIPLVMVGPWVKTWSKTQDGKSPDNSLLGTVEDDLQGFKDLLLGCQAQAQKPLLLIVEPEQAYQRHEKISLYREIYGAKQEILPLKTYSVPALQEALNLVQISKYDAFFCLADIAAIAVQRSLDLQRHRAIVTGYGNTPMGRLFDIPSIDNNVYQQGIEAFNKFYLGFSYWKIHNKYPLRNDTILQSRFIRSVSEELGGKS